jgi:hypothetical protein
VSVLWLRTTFPSLAGKGARNKKSDKEYDLRMFTS